MYNCKFNPIQAQILLRSIADKEGITVKYVPDQKQVPMVNMEGEVTMRQPLPTYTRQDWIDWWSSMFHECGHMDIELSDSIDYIKEVGNDPRTPKGMLINFLVDYRNERNKYDLYLGKKMTMDISRGQYYDNLLTKYSDAMTAPADSLLGIVFRTCVLFDGHSRKDWMPSVDKSLDSVMKLVPDIIQDKVQLMIDLDYKTRIDNVITLPKEERILEEVAIAEHMLKNVFDVPDEGEGGDEGDEPNEPDEGDEGDEGEQGGEPSDEEQDGEGDGGGESADGDDGEESESDSVNETSSEGDGDDDSESEVPCKDGDGDGDEPLWADLMYDKSHDPDYKNDSHIEQESRESTGNDSGFIVPYPLDKMAEINFTNDTVKYFTPTSNHQQEQLDMLHRVMRDEPDRKEYKYMQGVTDGKALSRKVERLLLIETRSSMAYNKKRGKLHSKNLYRTGIKEAKGFNERVFKCKVDNNALDVAVSIPMDWSGSMWGSKIRCAMQAARLMNTVFNGIGINYEIGGFSDWSRDALLNMLFKPFGVKVSNDDLVKYMCRAVRIMSNNSDADSIQWAYERLLTQKEKRKILIVLSDGQPAGGMRGSDSRQHLRDTIERIEGDSRVEVYGLGIEDVSVRDFYTEHSTITNASELNEALLSLIKRKIIKK